MLIKKDNFYLVLSKGKADAGFYSQEQKATLHMSMNLPEKPSEKTVGLLDRIQILLKGMDLVIDRAKDDFKKEGD